MKTPERGPVYGCLLLVDLPLNGGMKQAMPSRDDLNDVRQVSERTVAGFEVLTAHYRNAMSDAESKQETLQKVYDFSNKMSRSGSADRARAGNDVLELLDQMEFKPERNQSGEATKKN